MADVLKQLQQGRSHFDRREWHDALEAFSAADRADPLGPADLELLATAAYLVGRTDDYHEFLNRAHVTYRDAGDDPRAARCAFWMAFDLFITGESSRAAGWLARAQRLVEGRDCVEVGYLLIPVVERQLASDPGLAHQTASEAVAIGERFGDADLVACARHLEGRALILERRIREGLSLLDEVMVAVTAGELSPIVTGLVYCSVIEACRRAHTLARAREWTSALARWCDDQPGLVPFTGICLVYRAEILQLSGAWPAAIEEAQRACERLKTPGEAHYQQGEVHRLRGEFAAAEEAYANASRGGWEPQPGLALLRLAQGRGEAAVAAIRRVVGASTNQLQRVKRLAAYVDIMLEAGDTSDARDACRELDEIAGEFDSDVLNAMAAQARGAAELAEGDAKGALASLRRAWQIWQQVDVPYEEARARTLIGLACRALGDNDGCALELEAARATFDRLGAVPDRARLDSLAGEATAGVAHGLTDREIEVVRLVAAGKTNRRIAEELSISDKTVARHLSNIFTKLGLSTRAAATAYAYEHGLV